MKAATRSRLTGCLAAIAVWIATAFGQAAAVVGPSVDGASLAPYVVMVLNRSGATAGFCSAIVVNRDAVLTAAHCVPAGAALRVHYRGQDGQPILLPVVATVSHPDYNADAVRRRQRSIDLALVRLGSPLPDRFRPATIAAATPGAPEGTSFRIAGFGVTREGEGASSGHLRIATVEVRKPLSNVLLWARDPSGRGTGACTGDSGAPVFEAKSDAVAALTLWSAGQGTARCGALTQALWLAPQRVWIAGVLRQWGIDY